MSKFLWGMAVGAVAEMILALSMISIRGEQIPTTEPVQVTGYAEVRMGGVTIRRIFVKRDANGERYDLPSTINIQSDIFN